MNLPLLRKICATFLSLAAGASALFPSAVFAQFTDIAKDSLSYMYSQHVIDGYADGTFRPLDSINRAELIKLLMSGANLQADQNLKSCFSEVGAEGWYVPWVCTAKQKGWVGGYADGTFKPENTVNKAEAAKIIFGVLGLDEADDALYRFKDVPENAWFFQYATALGNLYYIDWTRNFLPATFIIRGEVAEIVFRDILAKKLYPPLKAKEVLAGDYPPRNISEAESLALTARDFFRMVKVVEALTYDQLTQEQAKVDAAYLQAKKDYPGPYPDPEQWNYRVMMEDGNYVYGVLSFYSPDNEMPMVWRAGWDSWAILKFDKAGKKLLAYDFFTRLVDRPSLVPNLVSVKDDVVVISLGASGPEPASMGKDGEHLTFTLRNFR